MQIAVNKDGVLRGNYHDLLTDTVTPILGAVDKQNQRVAMKLQGNDSVVVETGLYNLTNDEVPVLVHFGPDRQETRTLNPSKAAGGRGTGAAIAVVSAPRPPSSSGNRNRRPNPPTAVGGFVGFSTAGHHVAMGVRSAASLARAPRVHGPLAAVCRKRVDFRQVSSRLYVCWERAPVDAAASGWRIPFPASVGATDASAAERPRSRGGNGAM